MGLVYVSAKVTAKAGKEAALEQALADVVPAVRGEDGCIRYDLHKTDDGKAFMFYEIWESMPHLEAHGKAPHMVALGEARTDFVDGPTEVEILEAVDVAN